ncbi:hypothetical protein KC359_g172 [Hortaea werneckii]|nr:hypothetical protein KC359_g172 [Hortaea werneckii]
MNNSPSSACQSEMEITVKVDIVPQLRVVDDTHFEDVAEDVVYDFLTPDCVMRCPILLSPALVTLCPQGTAPVPCEPHHGKTHR